MMNPLRVPQQPSRPLLQPNPSRNTKLSARGNCGTVGEHGGCSKISPQIRGVLKASTAVYAHGDRLPTYAATVAQSIAEALQLVSIEGPQL